MHIKTNKIPLVRINECKHQVLAHFGPMEFPNIVLYNTKFKAYGTTGELYYILKHTYLPKIPCINVHYFCWYYCKYLVK